MWVYPNPASNQLSISMDLEKIEIFDLGGIKRFSDYRLFKGQNIDISFLNAGLYAIQGVAAGGQLYHSKLSVVPTR